MPYSWEFGNGSWGIGYGWIGPNAGAWNEFNTVSSASGITQLTIGVTNFPTGYYFPASGCRRSNGTLSNILNNGDYKSGLA